MKKIAILFLLLVSFLIGIGQTVAYKPFAAYYRDQGTSWDWINLGIEYDEMPTIKITYNNSEDVCSRIDRIKIDNKFKDDFRFPYKGEYYKTGIIYQVIDNKGKNGKVLFDFEYYEDGYFDLVFKYNNIEYAYRILKNE